ncbi:MAG: NADH-quinone oxidoreductase subunit NuoN [Gammaproteobacteria bacterium]|nr:NADH-quinone oxidoreductase subunit NuoN [Gammaproteobacteria bacterium]MCW8923774.1 NADH-quinone oxidoreductase subunit NuoN [Gammaproteobacteria bacterium]
MTLEALNYLTAWPEIFLLGMACIVLVVDAFISDDKRDFSYLLAQFSLAGTFVLLMLAQIDGRVVSFNGMFVQDAMSVVLKLFIVAITAITFVYSRDYLKDRNIFKGEYYVLGLFAVLGMMLMVSANNLLMIYLGLELLSLCLYAMVAFNRDNGNASEAAMKYFVLGAIASGMLLYGMSILYGLSGSLVISDIAVAVNQATDTRIGMVFALVFILVALAFKLGAVPFHMWVPDVYQGSPTAVTAFIGTAPKLAGFAMIIRLLVEGMGDLQADWQQMLIILAVLSMATGNVIAIAQTNIKRMLAYSTISHVGFILLGILAGTKEAYASAMFYTIAYAVMSLGGFGIIMLLARKGLEAENLDDFKGLNQRSPWFAFLMMVLMLSMAGVPPTLGFWAKLAVLKVIVEIDMVWLALVAVFFSIIGIFYYLRVIKVMYFDEAVDDQPLSCGRDMQITLSSNALLVLAWGLYPAGLMSLCLSVF